MLAVFRDEIGGADSGSAVFQHRLLTLQAAAVGEFQRPAVLADGRRAVADVVRYITLGGRQCTPFVNNLYNYIYQPFFNNSRVSLSFSIKALIVFRYKRLCVGLYSLFL